jgi:hypothetical protein
MYHLFPGRKILTSVAFLVATLAAYLAYWFEPTNSSLATLRYISGIIFVVDIAFLLLSTILWRSFWKYIPILSEIIFPDVNGIWEGKILFDNGSDHKYLDAKARVRQNFWSIKIDLYTTTSKSSTLVAYPTNDAGNPMIYYVYHNIPQNPKYPEYKGTSILEIKCGKAPKRLSGHYYTIRGTKGRVELQRVSENPNGSFEMW